MHTTRILLKQSYFTNTTAIVHKNILSRETCMDLIKLGESTGFKMANVQLNPTTQSKYAPNIRNNERCIVNSPILTDSIWNLIKEYVPDKNYLGKSYRPIGINSELRFLKYTKGNFFKKHYDGTYVINNLLNFMTLQLYLNENFEGGETKLYDPLDKTNTLVVKPTEGMMLIFDHEIMHEGMHVVNGTKYNIRTDILFETNS
jgi:predicted 2-oxoglutarate/Fe(II)-dependent dioxygenase YbiX